MATVVMTNVDEWQRIRFVGIPEGEKMRKVLENEQEKT